MKGIVFYVQLGIFGLAGLFFLISFGGGIWWENEHDLYHMTFTLWRICSKYKGEKDQCLSIFGERLDSGIKRFFKLFRVVSEKKGDIMSTNLPLIYFFGTKKRINCFESVLFPADNTNCYFDL